MGTALDQYEKPTRARAAEGRRTATKRRTTATTTSPRSRAGSKALAGFALVAALLVVIALVRRGLENAELGRALAQWEELRGAGKVTAATIPVLVPVYSRPEYLREVLQALKAAHNVENTVLVFSQDGQNEEVARLIAAVDFAPVLHLRHRQPYFGLPSLVLRTDAPTAANVFFLLSFAFEYARVRAAVVLESDIVPSPDFLDYFAWVEDALERDPDLRARVFTANGYYERSSPQLGDPFSVTTDEYGFMVWGWMCPGHSWPLIRDGWTWFHNWDITLEYSVRQPSGKVSLSPTISRMRNIGMKGINFNVNDPKETRRWLTLPVIAQHVNYAGQTLRVVPTRESL